MDQNDPFAGLNIVDTFSEEGKDPFADLNAIDTLPQDTGTGEDPFAGLNVVDTYGDTQNLDNYNEDLFKGDYAPSDLLEGQRYKIMDKALKDRFGVEDMDGYTKEEKLDKYLNWMRYFDAGNTVQTALEVDHIYRDSSEEKLRSYRDAINLFEGLGGVTSDSYTWGETGEAVKDYIWGAVVDPVNVFAPIYGKAFATGGAKGVATVAKKLGERELKRQIAKGASKRVATSAANKVKGAALKRAYRNQGKKLLAKEVVGATVFDTAAAVGTNVAYQNLLLRVDAREDYSNIETGLAALGGLVGGGISLGVVAARGTSKLPMANLDVKELSVTEAADVVGVLDSLTENIKKIPKDRMKKYGESFKAKVSRGEEFEIKDTDFFVDLVLGNDELGYKGLAHILQESGFVYRGKRYTNHPKLGDDNFMNWMADALRQAPTEEAFKFIKAFEDATGVPVSKVSKVTGKTTKQKRAVDVLADNLSKKASDSGRFLGATGRAAKILGVKPGDKITPDDYAKALFGPDFVDEVEFNKLSSTWKDLTGSVGEGVSYYQDVYVRMLVAHPGTSALNIAGWSTKSTMQSASDLLRSTVYHNTRAAVNLLKGDVASASSDFNKLVGTYKANAFKIRNLLDPQTTAEAFESLVDRNPDVFSDLTQVLPGGVIQSGSKKLQLKSDTPLYQQATDKGVDFIQRLSLVKAQDVFTKSQEYMYNIDVLLRENFIVDGRPIGYRDLIQRADAPVLMNTKKFKELEIRAIDRTLENIMSKSYKNKELKGLSHLAAIIEDFRKIPIIGVNIPFGRFFNNTVATSSEFIGITGLAKLANVSGVGANKSFGELASKAAVAWTAVGLMVSRETELMKRGIAWDEEVDENTGQRVSERYDAPAIGLKAMARIMAMRIDGQEVPERLIKDAGDAVFGQLTRQLTEAEKSVLGVAVSFLAGDLEAAGYEASELLKGTPSTAISGLTRFLEPVNVGYSLTRGPEDYEVLDVKQGNSFLRKSLRYVDSFVDTVGAGDREEGGFKRQPLLPDTSRQPGKAVGYRAIESPTSATRVFSLIGRPSWDAGIRASSPEAKAVVTTYFQPIFEAKAEELLKNPLFIKADIKTKKSLVDKALKEARNSTRDLLESDPRLRNRKSAIMFKLSANNKIPTLDKYIKELGYEGEIEDLTYEQLQVLDYFISSEGERQIEEMYRQ